MEPQILIDFGTADRRPPVRVRILRNMICPPLGCSPRPVSIGEGITISAATLDQLGSDDVEVLGTAPPELAYDI